MLSKMKKFNLDITVLGDEFVGKTAIMERLVNGRFSNSYVPTVGDTFEMRTRRRPSGPSEIDLRIFDTCGSMEFPAMTKVLIEQSDAFVIVYSVDSERSLKRAHQFINIVSDITNLERVPLILVGNKADLASERQVSFEKGLQLAVEARVPFMEVSAKNGNCIEDIFFTLLKRIDTVEVLKSCGIASYLRGPRMRSSFWKKSLRKSLHS